MSRIEVIGDATLYLGDCLAVVPGLPTIDAVLTDPPYSSGGQFRGDRTGATSTKYQSTEQHGLYPEFPATTAIKGVSVIGLRFGLERASRSRGKAPSSEPSPTGGSFRRRRMLCRPGAGSGGA